ncbi:MAG: S46 family peptidase [Sphingomonas sp.]|nr:S46 family peptidase [Sphingomonas sp.]
MHHRLLAATAITALLPFAAHADEGMWTFDAFPAAKVKAAYGAAPDQAWLDRVRQSAVRLTGGCSASVVSLQGLVLTNNHCVVDCAQALSTAENDLMKNGFVAADKPRELKCPGQQAEIVTAISDVTPEVQKAIGTNSGAAFTKARDAAISAIEKQSCTDPARERCQVVTLFGGGQYKLYRYRKYSDVRLVYAPEFQAAFFGGDPDNFNFPRYDIDAAFLRLYESGKPATTKAHLTWNARAPKAGELTYVVGNPGSTQRLYTQAQIAFQRDTALPTTELLLSEFRGRLISAMATDEEKNRTGSDQLFGIENSFKAYYGQWQALLDPTFSGKLSASEQALRAKVAADPMLSAKVGDPWGEVEKAVSAYRTFFDDYTWLERRPTLSELFYDARRIVRSAQERAKPNAERLPEYGDARLPLLEKELTDPHPIYPWLEELEIGMWLSKAREHLTVDAPAVKRLLGKESPEALARRLVSGTKLADPAVRKTLYDGGLAAVEASDDPLIKFVLATDADARTVLQRYRAEYDAPVTAAQSRLSLARFAAYGNDVYPDATFTLRISYGAVQGWTYQGQAVPDRTLFGGLYERATGAAPFDLPPKWAAAEGKIDKARVINFVTTNDIIGGNSGSPVIAADGSVIGAAFDGNIHSLGGAYGYDAKLNRTVVVSTGAVEEALTKVYPAPALLKELHGH